jgi:hypothetical protein
MCPRGGPTMACASRWTPNGNDACAPLPSLLSCGQTASVARPASSNSVVRPASVTGPPPMSAPPAITSAVSPSGAAVPTWWGLALTMPPGRSHRPRACITAKRSAATSADHRLALDSRLFRTLVFQALRRDKAVGAARHAADCGKCHWQARAFTVYRCAHRSGGQGGCATG